MTRKIGCRQDLRFLWPTISAVIFDVEGTLVDAVPLTLLCWQETLKRYGFAVTRATLQCLSGMDGHDMLARIAPGLPANRREEIIVAQGKRFEGHYLKRVRPFRAANTLLRQIRHAGRKVGLATDCSGSELTHYLPKRASYTARRLRGLW
jgi:phosphoglycolate phosphatase-like HAD superfamily hydrolase